MKRRTLLATAPVALAGCVSLNLGSNGEDSDDTEENIENPPELRRIRTEGYDVSIEDVEPTIIDGQEYITGLFRNESDEHFDTVTLRANLYDEDETLIDDSGVNGRDIEPGIEWRFEIRIDEFNFAMFDVTVRAILT